jgi:pectate lyase
MNKKVFAILVVTVVLVLACVCPALQSLGNTPSVTNPPVDTAMPILQQTQQPSVSSVLFQDDFSNVNSGWDRSHYDTYSTDYENGGYRINIIPPTFSTYANPYQTFQNDVRIEVDATKIGGPDDNTFGVQCRYQDVDNYYFFYISSDGYVGIGMNKAGTQTIISDADGILVSDSSINQGAATNHIRADCIGNTLMLFVNGTQVATASDGSFTGGDVGLISKTQSVGGTDILFDNFLVYKP